MENKFLSLLLLAALLFSGCKSTESNLYKATGVTVITVDGAMKAWADYVKTGRASQGDQDKARAAYEKYYRAILVEKAAIIAYKSSGETNALSKVLGTISAASAELVGLLETLLPTETVLKLKGEL